MTADPITLITIAGSALSAVGSVIQGKAQADQADRQAEVLRQQAERERQIARADAEDFEREQSARLARRRALTGAAGVEVGAGSPLLTAEDFAAEVELQRRRILATGVANSTRLTQQASLEEERGDAAFTSGLFRGGSLLLEGAGSVFGGGSRSPLSSRRPSRARATVASRPPAPIAGSGSQLGSS